MNSHLPVVVVLPNIGVKEVVAFGAVLEPKLSGAEADEDTEKKMKTEFIKILP